MDGMDRWTSCHLTIYEPAWYIRYTRSLIVLAVFIGFFGLITYQVLRRRLRRQYLLATIERRRSRRTSGDVNAKARKQNAFRNS
jgi:hypothetical protein